MDEKTEGDKTEKELKKVKSSKSGTALCFSSFPLFIIVTIAKPPKDSVKSADGSKKVSSSQKFADSMKKARLAYWPRLCRNCIFSLSSLLFLVCQLCESRGRRELKLGRFPGEAS